MNIAAGIDISLGEFSEVGATVEEFSSENATVVIGTVIDQEMGDEIRVTVVATGLGDLQERPQKLSDEVKKKIAGDGSVDYGDLDRPTIIRNAAQEAGSRELAPTKDLEYLDIPAFLRRQAD